MARQTLLLIALAVLPLAAFNSGASAPHGSARRHASPLLQGGPPPGVSVQAGGPPPGSTSTGPPGASGSPGGPPRGGPPKKNAPQLALDAFLEVAFKVLYATEPELRLDSYKNLQVLWVRALLASCGKLEDDVAFELLPAASRWIVGPSSASFWTPVLPKLEWIAQRTTFIDQVLESWRAALPEGSEAPQVVLIGSGYDTRALRYAKRDPRLAFFEIDLPVVTRAKGVLSSRFAASTGVRLPAMLPLDLMTCAGGAPALDALAPLGFDPSRPTLVVFEAVLFYLSPPAKSNLLKEAAVLINSSHPASELVLTDNLAPFLRSPARADAEGYFGGALGLTLEQHSTLWGGAIQFARARAGSPRE